MAQVLRAAETVGGTQIELGLNAAIVSVRDQQPQILVVHSGEVGSGEWDALPFGKFAPREHRTLEIGLRAWVKRQTGLDLGYVEQLYTFGDRGRHAQPGDTATHILSVGYLALTRGAGDELQGSHWSPWYAYFPWEDWRQGKPEILTREIEPRLKEWAERPPSPDEPARPLRRAERLIEHRPRDGVMVQAYGRIEFWRGRAQLSMRVERLELAGEGLLRARVAALRAVLEAEGLTDPARKARPPLLPRRIGLVTSPDGAARGDVLTNLWARMPQADVVLVSVPVQGEAAGPPPGPPAQRHPGGACSSTRSPSRRSCPSSSACTGPCAPRASGPRTSCS